MYTIQENVRIAIAILKEYGVKKIVVSPGGTNIPVVQAVQEDPFLIVIQFLTSVVRCILP